MKLLVKQNENEIPVEVIAESIKAISQGFKKLKAGPLNEKAIVLLIQHASPSLAFGKRVGTTEIRAVLDGIEALEKAYLKPKKAKGSAQ